MTNSKLSYITSISESWELFLKSVSLLLQGGKRILWEIKLDLNIIKGA